MVLLLIRTLNNVQRLPLLIINKLVVYYSDSGTSRYADELNKLNEYKDMLQGGS